jgi:hypothetical protein
MGLQDVMTALGVRLRTIPNFRAYDFPSSRIEPPASVLSLPETGYDVTMGGGSYPWVFPLWVLVSKADDKSSYNEMVPYLEAEGERSIRAILFADKTLGGACDTLDITNARPQMVTVGGTEFLAIEFTLEVYT